MEKNRECLVTSRNQPAGDTGNAPPHPALANALMHADLRVLLLVLFHMTGDHKWFAVKPKRDTKLVADEDAGLSQEQQLEIREAALKILASNRTPAIIDPGDSLMVKMMSWCLGETVPPEYGRPMREELGFVSREVTWQKSAPPSVSRHRVVIVGAGVSGLALAARLQKLGIEFTVVERNPDVGGVWLENGYPGAGVDTPSHAYSFSFGSRYRWSSYFSPRDEILAYIRRSADDFGVRGKIHFQTEVRSATWDDATSLWRVKISTPRGEGELTASVLVSAIGQFGQPAIPAIDGAEHFGGILFHSARWPEGFTVEGKRVAVLGTGASAMQIVPTIVDSARSVDVYQRSAQWARPIARYHDHVNEDAQWLLGHVPFYAQWFRFTMWWRYGDGLFAQLRKDPTWPHQSRSINERNDRHRHELTNYIRAELADRPDLIEKCVPTYPPFGKRILLDNGWYRAISRNNVELISDKVAHLTPNGIETVDGKHRQADVIILATGFQMTQMAARLNITGRDGRNLALAWGGDNPTAYLGITVPYFPNLFLMQGPNAGLGHGGSAIFQAESQARYISACLVELMERDLLAMEIGQEAHDKFVELVDAEHEQMIWTHPGMSTYYRNKQGRVVTVMPFRLVDYWRMTHEADLEHYHLRPARLSPAAAG